MTFKKAETAKTLRNGLSVIETNPLNHNWLDFANQLGLALHQFQKNLLLSLPLNVYSWLPIIVLYISVLNEFDLNYLNIEYFSFNFPLILIFYFSLKDYSNFDYLLVFFAGLINDFQFLILTFSVSIKLSFFWVDACHCEALALYL